MASASDIANALDREIRDALKPLNEAQIKAIGDEAITIINLRTKQGLDADRKKFEPYSDGYKKHREMIGRSSSTVDLAVTGHMQQAMQSTPHVGDGSVEIGFMNPIEEKKAAIHNSGVDTVVSVRSHRRSVHVNAKNGQRVSAKEVALDKKRKNKRTTVKREEVSTFQRHQKTPKREWFDIRHPVDVALIEAVIMGQYKGDK